MCSGKSWSELKRRASSCAFIDSSLSTRCVKPLNKKHLFAVFLNLIHFRLFFNDISKDWQAGTTKALLFIIV
jgi:hypothetical protein